MDKKLQIILIISSLLFFMFIFNMIRNRKIDTRFTLTWMGSSLGLVILATFPGLIEYLARVLFVKDPVNTLFLIIIFFLLIIVFNLSTAISKAYTNIVNLSQELGILKLKVYSLNEEVKNAKELMLK